jgi:hypothetical protein
MHIASFLLLVTSNYWNSSSTNDLNISRQIRHYLKSFLDIDFLLEPFASLKGLHILHEKKRACDRGLHTIKKNILLPFQYVLSFFFD